MRNQIVSAKKSDSISHWDQESYLLEVYQIIKHAESFYPSFKSWFWDTVVPQLNSSQRKIIVEKRDSKVVGVAILKDDGVEKKLCNLTVAHGFQNKGVGLKLFERSFAELNTSKPFLTVSEEKYLEFQRLFEHYGFSVSKIEESLYLDGKVEYFLNEEIVDPSSKN